MSAPFIKIWRPDSPLANCANCGRQLQFHNRPDADCCTDFRAETADDLDPADLSNADLIQHCDATMARHERCAGRTDADLLKIDSLDDRIGACREEISARIKAVFGVGFDDLRQTMGW